MHCCIPDSSFRIFAYLFFLAFFFAAILFSSKLSRFRASVAGGARIQSSCIVTPNYLVKKKVTFATKKMKLRQPNPEKQKSTEKFARVNPQAPPRPQQPPCSRKEVFGVVASAAGRSWARFYRIFNSGPQVRGGWIESFPDRAPI
jgi:hypothetical protein